MDSLVKENNNFSGDLKIQYLTILKEHDEKKEFDSIYKQTSGHISSRIETSDDLVELKTIEDILGYEKTIAVGKNK